MADVACALCGLPAAPPSEPGPPFCCSGCRNVFEILSLQPGGPPADLRGTELFRACAAAGLLGGEAPAPPAAEGNEDLAEETVFRVEGMWCPACAWWIESSLRRSVGVVGARASFATDRATVRYLPHRTSPETLAAVVRGLGYGASALGETPERAAARRDRVLRLGVSSILTANLMMISMALYGGFFAELGAAGTLSLSLPQWALATPVVFYGGWPILRRAWGALRGGTATMDTLIAVGSLSAYGYSLAAVIGGSLHVYFDTAAMLVTLTLLGRAVEGRARERALGEAAGLWEWAEVKARVRGEGGERWVAAASLSPGDEVVVRAGERAAVDGRVAAGAGHVDRTVLTGETRPLAVGPGDEVPGGARVVDGELRLATLRPASESAAGRMLALMEEALARRTPAEALADRVTRRLVPAVLGLGALTAAALLAAGTPARDALGRALAVLVVTCPCALGIATPLAKAAALGAARRRGLLFRDPGALELIPRVDAVVLDKTGTVTTGEFTLRRVAVEGATPEEALRRAAALEAVSSHLLGRELLRHARASGVAEQAAAERREVPGLGVSGVVGGQACAAGSLRWMESSGLRVPPELARRRAEWEAEGHSAVLVGWEGSVRALFAFGDGLRPEAESVARALRARGLRLYLVSGDSVGAVEAAAQQLPLHGAFGGALPADKVGLVRELQRGCGRVAMVGDGVNDAAALAAADVGIAVGAGSELPLRRAAAVALLAPGLEALPAVFDHGVLAGRMIRQNLCFAFLYNVVAIPVALSGLLTPIAAAACMLASSLAVVLNTLRLSRGRDRAHRFATSRSQKRREDLSALSLGESCAPVPSAQSLRCGAPPSCVPSEGSGSVPHP